MRNIFLLLIAITSSKLAIAQNPYLDYKYALKISNLSTLNFKEVVPQYDLSPYALSVKSGDEVKNKFQLFHPTVSFDWMTKRKNTHEIELINLVLNKERTKTYNYELNGVMGQIIDKTTETAISLRYTYLINFCKQKESKWVPSLGFSFNPYYQYTKSILTNSFSYQTGTQTLGIRASINPRLTYFFSKNIFVFSELSFAMLDIHKSTFLNPANPLQPDQKDKQTYYNIRGIKSSVDFRVGFGYKF